MSAAQQRDDHSLCECKSDTCKSSRRLVLDESLMPLYNILLKHDFSLAPFAESSYLRSDEMWHEHENKSVVSAVQQRDDYSLCECKSDTCESSGGSCVKNCGNGEKPSIV